MDLIQSPSCFIFYNIFCAVLLVSIQGKPMDAVSTFTGNYSHQPAVLYLFMTSVIFSLMLKFKSDIIKDVSPAKMSHSFAAGKVLMKRTFFVFSAFLFLFMRSQGCSMFLLELVMKQTCRVYLSMAFHLDTHWSGADCFV